MLMLFFAFQGALITIWGIHIPVFSEKLDLDTGEIGLILLTSGFGAIVASQLVGKLVDIVSSKVGALIGAAASGIVCFLPPLMPDFGTLLVAMFVWGIAIGTSDISINAQAVEYERLSGKRNFTFFHAFWSLGGGMGALYASAMLAVGAPVFLTFAIPGVIWLVLPPLARNWLIAKTQAQTESQSAGKSGTAAKQSPRIVLAVLALGIMGGAGALVEGIGIDWAALQQTEDLGVTPARAGFAVFAFTAAMAAFRFFADRFVESKGRMFIIRYGALLSAVGMFIGTSLPDANLALIGWLLAGLGISAVVPQIFALSADIGSIENSARNMAKVFGLTYAGLLAGPAVIGWLAGFVELSTALKLGSLLCIGIWAISIWVDRVTKTTNTVSPALESE
jgi:MFS family permease